MIYNFTQAEENKIIEHYGHTFYEKVKDDIRTYSEKWSLEILQFIDYYSINCIFLCRSKEYGDVVLKVGNPSKEVFTEVNILKEYNGRGFCTLINSDIENGIILEERINPGTRLREEKSLEKRLFIFSDLFRNLHIEPHSADLYPTYFRWVSRITEYMSKREDYKELYNYMKKANDLCSSICAAYPKKMLLHGDLHHDNILLGKNNGYKIIDPKGVIGDPIFDIPRFILNEFHNMNGISYDFYSKHVNQVVNYFEESLNIPKDVLKKCLYIETVMANCWNVESNEKPNINEVIYAESVMDS